MIYKIENDKFNLSYKKVKIENHKFKVNLSNKKAKLEAKLITESKLIEYYNVIKNETSTVIETYIADHNIDINKPDKYNLLYYLTFFQKLSKIKYFVNNKIIDLNQTFDDKSILDLAIEWCVEDNIIEYFKSMDVKELEENKSKSIYDGKNAFNPEDDEYQSYLSLYEEFLNNNSNFFNFNKLRGILLQSSNDEDEYYSILDYTILGGVLNTDEIKDFDFNKVKILLIKNICNARKSFELLLKNIDKYENKDNVMKLIKYFKSTKVGVKFNVFSLKKLIKDEEFLNQIISEII